MSIGFELYALRKDGGPFPVEISLSPIQTPQGLLVASTIRDITARKQAEAALRESEERYRATFEQAAVGVAHNDSAGRFLWMNQQYCNMLGYTREELLQRTWQEITHPDDVAADWEQARQLLAGEIRHYSIEKRYLRKDGSPVWVSLTTSLLRDASGTPKYGITVAEDISERRRAEETLSRLASIVESSDDAIIGETLDGIVTNWNPGAERLYGYSADEMIGKSIATLFPPEQSEEFRYTLDAIRRGQRIGHFETVRLRKDGQRVDVSLSLSPIRDAAGSITGVSAIARDITVQKEMEARQRELERQREQTDMVKRFIGDASHDLRTPLTIMGTSLWLLRRLCSESPDQLAYIDQVQEQVLHMQKLVEDLFTLTWLDTASGEFRFDVCDLNTVVEVVIEGQRPLAERKHHRLTHRFADDIPLVALDQAEFMPALKHILVNALNYTPDGGAISVETRAQDGQAVIEVRDNGIGISAEDLPHIFERFYRADKARSVTTGSAGLGLTIAKRIIEMHGGTIEVESAPGAGSVFRVRLPVHESL